MVYTISMIFTPVVQYRREHGSTNLFKTFFGSEQNVMPVNFLRCRVSPTTVAQNLISFSKYLILFVVVFHQGNLLMVFKIKKRSSLQNILDSPPNSLNFEAWQVLHLFRLVFDSKHKADSTGTQM